MARNKRGRRPTGDPEELHQTGRRMSPEEIRWIREQLDISQDELAQLMGVTFSTVNRWENGPVGPKGPAMMVLRILYAILQEAEEYPDRISIEEIREVVNKVRSGKIVTEVLNKKGVSEALVNVLAGGSMAGVIVAIMILKWLAEE